MIRPGAGGALRRAADAAAGHATTFGHLSGWRVVRWLPEPAARRVFDRIADQVHRKDGRGVQRLRSNLRRVRPDLPPAELDALVHAALRSYMRYWCESFRLPSWSKEDMVARTRTVGEEAFRDAYASGRGVVAALPHMGNWDWAGAWACSTGMPLLTVAERLEPARLFDEFVAYRRSLGMEILPLTGDPALFDQLVRWARGGGLVCLLADRDLSRNGLEVDLCGQRARMPRGPAVLARSTGAALVPVTLAYDGPEMVITFHPEVPPVPGEEGIVEMMQGVADRFGDAIREHPADWHMMQKVFSADLTSGRS